MLFLLGGAVGGGRDLLLVQVVVRRCQIKLATRAIARVKRMMRNIKLLSFMLSVWIVLLLSVLSATVVVVIDAIIAICVAFFGMAYLIWLCFRCCSVFFFDAVKFGSGLRHVTCVRSRCASKLAAVFFVMPSAYCSSLETQEVVAPVHVSLSRVTKTSMLVCLSVCDAVCRSCLVSRSYNAFASTISRGLCANLGAWLSSKARCGDQISFQKTAA